MADTSDDKNNKQQKPLLAALVFASDAATAVTGIASGSGSGSGGISSATPAPAAAVNDCRPWDRDAYAQRVATFTVTGWFGKPKSISPLVCARFGWILAPPAPLAPAAPAAAGVATAATANGSGSSAAAAAAPPTGLALSVSGVDMLMCRNCGVRIAFRPSASNAPDARTCDCIASHRIASHASHRTALLHRIASPVLCCVLQWLYQPRCSLVLCRVRTRRYARGI